MDKHLNKDGKERTNLRLVIVSFLVEIHGNQMTKHVIGFDKFAKWFAVF